MMRRKRIFLALITSCLIIFFSFVFEAFNKRDRYVILAGEYLPAGIGLPRLKKGGLDFYFRTNDTWYYSCRSGNEWHRIRGISQGVDQDCSSAYLVYRCVDDSLLIIGSCCVVNDRGQNTKKEAYFTFDTIESGRRYHCRIALEEGMYKFSFAGSHYAFGAGEEQGMVYLAGPGLFTDKPLDHDWMVDMMEGKY
jgi:hypothetical protein